MEMQFNLMDDVVKNISVYLILFGAGAITWFARQLIPDEIEEKRAWKLLFRALPVCIATGLSIIPGLRPLPVLSQSIVFGVILGTFSTLAYGLLRAAAPNKIKAFLGSKSERLSGVSK